MAKKPTIPFNSAAARTGTREFLLYIQTGDMKMLEMEIRLDADIVNRSDDDGTPMLHHAVLEAQPEVVSLLLRAGAHPAAVNSHGETAANLARRLHFSTLADDIDAADTRRKRAEAEAAARKDYQRRIGALSDGHGYDIPVDVKRARFRKG